METLFRNVTPSPLSVQDGCSPFEVGAAFGDQPRGPNPASDNDPGKCGNRLPGWSAIPGPLMSLVYKFVTSDVGRLVGMTDWVRSARGCMPNRGLRWAADCTFRAGCRRWWVTQPQFELGRRRRSLPAHHVWELGEMRCESISNASWLELDRDAPHRFDGQRHRTFDCILS